MLTGMLHLHRTLAYLIFLVAIVNVMLVLASARTDSTMATVLKWSHGLGVLWAGRINLLAGMVLWQLQGVYPWMTVWIWVSILLWGPVEVLGKRLVKPEITIVSSGGKGSGRMVAGVALQLLVIAVIFGLMSARP